MSQRLDWVFEADLLELTRQRRCQKTKDSKFLIASAIFIVLILHVLMGWYLYSAIQLQRYEEESTDVLHVELIPAPTSTFTTNSNRASLKAANPSRITAVKALNVKQPDILYLLKKLLRRHPFPNQ